MRTSLLALIAVANLGGAANLGPAPSGYVVQELKPDAAWNGTVASMQTGAFAPAAFSYTYQGTPGFPEEVICGFDEYPGIFIEDAKHRIVVGAINGDPMRGGILGVIYRFGNVASPMITQQIYTSRKTCGFPIEISSNMIDGDAELIADVYPVRGFPTRIKLPLTLATRGDAAVKRPIVYVNPDTTSYTLTRADDGATITIGAGSDSVTRAQAANPATPFKSLQTAMAAFAGVGTGACDIQVVPDTALFCDQPSNILSITPNSNTRMIRVRSVTGAGKVLIGRNDNGGFFSDPNGDRYVYAPPSPAYGGFAGGVGVPLFDSDGSRVDGGPSPNSFASGGYYFGAAMIEFKGVHVDISTFSQMATKRVAVTAGSLNADGSFNFGNGFYAFTNNSEIIDPNGPTGPQTAYSDTQKGQLLPIYLPGFNSFCEGIFVGQEASQFRFMRNVTSTLSWDAFQSYNGAPPSTWWNATGTHPNLWYSRYHLPTYLKINHTYFKEDTFVDSPNTLTITGGTTATCTDAQGNPANHGLSDQAPNNVFLLKTGAHTYFKIAVGTVVSATVVTLKTAMANLAYSYSVGSLTTAPYGLTLASDGITASFTDVSATPTVPGKHNLNVGNQIVIVNGNNLFRTTVASVLSSTSLTLTDSYGSGLSSVPYQCGVTIVSVVPPSSRPGGYNHYYYSPTSIVGPSSSTPVMHTFIAIAGAVLIPLTGTLSAALLPISGSVSGDLPLNSCPVIPPNLPNLGAKSQKLPTMQTVGTALTLSAAPPAISLSYATDSARLWVGLQVINDGTDEARFITDVQSPTQATLNAPFTDGHGTNVNLPAGTVYRSGGYVAIVGNQPGLAIGDKFWVSGVAHPDYFQITFPNTPFAVSGKNWFLSNYSFRTMGYQIALTQTQLSNWSDWGTFSSDGNGNGIIAAPLSSALPIPRTLSTSTTTGATPVTTCTMSGVPTIIDNSGKTVASPLYPGQKIAVLNSDGSVFQTVTIKAFSNGSSTQFSTTVALSSDVTDAVFRIGHTVIQGDMVCVGYHATTSAQDPTRPSMGRRVTAISWDADFTQHLTFNEDFRADKYPGGVPVGTKYYQSKAMRNVAMVNCSYLNSGGPTGGGLGGALMHFVWAQCTDVAPYGGSGYGIRDDYSFSACQNSAFLDCFEQSISGHQEFSATDPLSIVVDNVSFLSSANGDPINDVVVTATWDLTYRPTSTAHRKIVGQLGNGSPTGKALVPYDADGNLLVPGLSYVGGAQPVSA